MEKNFNLPASILDAQLTIIQGSVKDLAPVKETLAPKDKRPASIIISGLGAYPHLEWKVPFIFMDDPHICEEGLSMIVGALHELRSEAVVSAEHKPLLCIVSTTGLSETRDVPYLLMPLYHILLKEPHKDKSAAEKVVATAAGKLGDNGAISNFVILRPTLLVDGVGKGVQAVKTGWEKHPSAPNAASGEGTKPAMGYQMRRADVGGWIFDEVIKGGNKWAGKCVSMAY